MSFELTTTEVKQFIIETLGLEDTTPEDIADDLPLFGDGLGLDSIDTLELGIALRKKYNIQLGEDASLRERLATVGALTAFLNSMGKEA